MTDDDDTIEAAVQRLGFSLMSGFVAESNRIEGIERPPSTAEIRASLAFYSTPPPIDTQHLVEFVRIIQPGARLRDRFGDDVRVGSHVPMPGGPALPGHLAELLADINGQRLTPYQAHVRYETLHPFMDGNGRSGRILWLWQMNQLRRHPFSLPFLHAWYYQSLEATQQ